MPAADGPRKRGFKDRRAPMACQRCRHLKKSCKQDGRDRCRRCCQTDQVCVYMEVGSDPTAPRSLGSSQPIVVPDSPTLSPSDPPSPTFEIYHTISSISDQEEGSQYAPHMARLRNDRNPLRPNPTPFQPTTNTQPSGPPVYYSPQSCRLSPSSQSPETFADLPLFDNTSPHIFVNDIYDHLSLNSPSVCTDATGFSYTPHHVQ